MSEKTREEIEAEENEVLEEQRQKELEKQQDQAAYTRGKKWDQLPKEAKENILHYFSELWVEAVEMRQACTPGDKIDQKGFGIIYAIDYILQEKKSDIDKYKLIKEEIKNRDI